VFTCCCIATETCGIVLLRIDVRNMWKVSMEGSHASISTYQIVFCIPEDAIEMLHAHAPLKLSRLHGVFRWVAACGMHP
jgi:hypothetical protein